MDTLSTSSAQTFRTQASYATTKVEVVMWMTMIIFSTQRCQLVTLGHPDLTYIFNFWHSGTLALMNERQSARMSEIKNVGWIWMALNTLKCNHLMPLPYKGLILACFKQDESWANLAGRWQCRAVEDRWSSCTWRWQCRVVEDRWSSCTWTWRHYRVAGVNVVGR